MNIFFGFSALIHLLFQFSNLKSYFVDFKKDTINIEHNDDFDVTCCYLALRVMNVWGVYKTV